MSQNSREGRKMERSNKAYDKWLQGMAFAVTYFERYLEEIQEERPTLTEVRVKCDPDDDEGVLVILKGYVGNVKYIAFHREATYSAAVTGAGNRLRNGSLKWREDLGYQGG